MLFCKERADSLQFTRSCKAAQPDMSFPAAKPHGEANQRAARADKRFPISRSPMRVSVTHQTSGIDLLLQTPRNGDPNEYGIPF